MTLSSEQSRSVIAQMKEDPSNGEQSLDDLAKDYSAMARQMFDIEVDEGTARAAVGKRFRR